MLALPLLYLFLTLFLLVTYRSYSRGRDDISPFLINPNRILREPASQQTGEGLALHVDLPAAPELPKIQRDPHPPLLPALLRPDPDLSTDKRSGGGCCSEKKLNGGGGGEKKKKKKKNYI